MVPLVITLASAGQLLLCCKAAESFLCKISWVDCTTEDTCGGNLQAVLFYSSFALYFKLNLFSSVRASWEMDTLTSVESMSQLCILHSTCADIKGISFVIANTHISLWQLLAKRLRSETPFHLVANLFITFKAFPPCSSKIMILVYFAY